MDESKKNIILRMSTTTYKYLGIQLREGNRYKARVNGAKSIFNEITIGRNAAVLRDVSIRQVELSGATIYYIDSNKFIKGEHTKNGIFRTISDIRRARQYLRSNGMCADFQIIIRFSNADRRRILRDLISNKMLVPGKNTGYL